MPRLEHKHPRAIRWFHWINFPLLALMIWSGLLIYWANDVYRIGIGRLTLFHFFPNGFYTLLGVEGRLAEGMAWHFFLMWLFALNGVAYVLYTLISGEWRELVPTRRSFGEAMQVTLYEFRLSKTLPPQGKYNSAQRITYSGIVLMGVGSLITGLAIYKPTQLYWLDWMLGGYPMARFFHFWLTVGYVVFFIVHVGQVARAGWNNFRSMVTGFDVVAGEASDE